MTATEFFYEHAGWRYKPSEETPEQGRMRSAESLAAPLSLALLRPPIDPGEYQEYLFHPHRAVQDPAAD